MTAHAALERQPNFLQAASVVTSKVGTVKVAHQTSRPKLSTFLVEDSPLIRENLIATLEELTPVLVVHTADEELPAVASLASHHGDCDLVIIDIFLRTGSGLGVLERGRALSAQLPLVVLTNYATPSMRQRCLDQGATRVFDKSSELDELLDFCRELATAQQPDRQVT